MKEKYEGIDGIKGMSILMIILVHVYYNGNYSFNRFWFSHIVLNLDTFVELFFMVSAFGMCCGYYNKTKNKEISVDDFYKKRYIRLLPFFSLVVLIELVASGINMNNLMEAFVDETLMFALLPNSVIEIVGLGWTLGVIFAFYITFPFFVFMIWTKKRAMFFLIVSIIFRVVCILKFTYNGERVNCNLLMWLCFFVLGGLLYLERETLKKANSKCIIVFILLVCGGMLVYDLYLGDVIGIQILRSILFSGLIIYAINPKTGVSMLLFRICGKYCMELYLAHMACFRFLEKIGIVRVLKNRLWSLFIVYLVTVLIAIGGAKVYNYCWERIEEKWIKK